MWLVHVLIAGNSLNSEEEVVSLPFSHTWPSSSVDCDRLQGGKLQLHPYNMLGINVCVCSIGDVYTV